jgi:sulfonate transport system substrate-binding protein
LNTKLIIGGVDEAFNVPWKRIAQRQPLKNKGVEIEWLDFGGGTGQIMRALNSNEIQVAIVLTEGVISDIYKNNQSRIFSSYVVSPLEWGVHVHESSPISAINEIKDKCIAISKFGSGSHLMAILNAYEQGWDVQDIKFKEINNLIGGLNALKTGEADVFFWEKHTTRAYLKPNLLKYIGSFKGPWGAFVVAVNNSLTKQDLENLKAIMKFVLEEAISFKLSHLSAPYITRFNNMDLVTAQSWLQSTRFASAIGSNQLEVLKVKEILFQSGILTEKTENEINFFVA